MHNNFEIAHFLCYNGYPMNTIKFKSIGWQAPIADGFTAVNVKRLVQAVISHILINPEYGFNSAEYKNFCKKRNINHKRPLIIIGYDTRFMSDYFARVAADIFAESNFAVKFSGESVPAAVVSYCVEKYAAIGGVTITGGESPYYVNGFKWTAFWGGPAIKEITNDIESRISHAFLETSHDSFHKNVFESSLIQITDFKKDYLKHLSSILDVKAIKKSGLKVVVDSLHGTTANFLPAFMENCGLKTVSIRQNRDVFFGGTDPITGPKSLSEISRIVVKNKFDLAIACDADGDGFGIVDEDGNWVSPNEIIALILKHLLENRNMRGKVCRNVVTSHFIDAVCKKYAVAVRETPIGFNNIGNLMRSGQYMLGAEESGGLSISTHVPDKDGMLACMLVIEMLSYYKKPFKKIRHEFHKEYGDFISAKISMPAKDIKIDNVMRKLELKPPLKLAGFSVWRIDHTDGFKFILKDLSWLAIRPSTFEPIVRLYGEATSKPKLEKILNEGRKILKGDF